MMEDSSSSSSSVVPPGFLAIEIKAPAPICDPFDTLSEAVATATVHVVLGQDSMADYIIFKSFSPVILDITLQLAPTIPRALLASGFQFLTIEQATNASIALGGGPVVPVINKTTYFGLEWFEAFPFARLPQLSQQSWIPLHATLQAQVATIDMRILQQAEMLQPGTGTLLVSTFKGAGIRPWEYTATNDAEWKFFAELGVEGITTDDLPGGIALQAPLPTTPAPSPITEQITVVPTGSPVAGKPTMTPTNAPPSDDSAATGKMSSCTVWINVVMMATTTPLLLW